MFTFTYCRLLGSLEISLNFLFSTRRDIRPTLGGGHILPVHWWNVGLFDDIGRMDRSRAILVFVWCKWIQISRRYSRSQRKSIFFPSDLKFARNWLFPLSVKFLQLGTGRVIFWPVCFEHSIEVLYRPNVEHVYNIVRVGIVGGIGGWTPPPVHIYRRSFLSENRPQTSIPGQNFKHFRSWYNTIRYDTIEEFNVDSKAEYTA